MPRAATNTFSEHQLSHGVKCAQCGKTTAGAVTHTNEATGWREMGTVICRWTKPVRRKK
jgi:hypothetical protein